MRSEPSLPLSHQEHGSPAPQRAQSYVVLARRMTSSSICRQRCLDVSVQSWHWVWSLQQPHVRKHCRSLIKLNIRQRDTRLICLNYGFRHFSFFFFLFFPFAQHSVKMSFTCVFLLKDWDNHCCFDVFYGTFHYKMPRTRPVKQDPYLGWHPWSWPLYSLAVTELKTVMLKSSV